MSETCSKHRQKRSANLLHPKAARIIRDGFFAYFTTGEIGAPPHITTMFYIWDEEPNKFYVITSRSTKKLQNIRQNPNVALTIDERDPISPEGNCGVLIRGTARVIKIEEMGDVLMNQYWQKYLTFLKVGFPMGSRVVIEITPKIIHFWKGIHFHKWTAQ